MHEDGDKAKAHAEKLAQDHAEKLKKQGGMVTY
jgi:hypothetical protein